MGWAGRVSAFGFPVVVIVVFVCLFVFLVALSF